MSPAIAELVQVAAAGGIDVEPLPREALYFGVSVRPLPDGQEVWLVRLLVNWRIVESREGWPGRFWCYPGTEMQTFAIAVQHAALYGDGEPDGWIKAWDGRRGSPVSSPA